MAMAKADGRSEVRARASSAMATLDCNCRPVRFFFEESLGPTLHHIQLGS